MKRPTLSIILCCRNPGALLKQAVASVLQQEAHDFELILIDAASRDGSLGLLPPEQTSRCRILSEPDGGVYEGMNKGIKLAQGDWVYFMGADDQLSDPRVLSDLLPLLETTKADLLVGRIRYTDGRVYGGSFRRTIVRFFLHHQASIYRRALFERQGLYDEQLRIQADYDFNLRLATSGATLLNTDRLIAQCGCGGLSDGGNWANYREEIQVRHRHFPAWKCWVWDVGSVLRYLRKRMVTVRK